MSHFQEKYLIQQILLETPIVSYYIAEEKTTKNLFRCARVLISGNADELEDFFTAFQSKVVAKAVGFVECLECQSSEYAIFVFTMPNGTSLRRIVEVRISEMIPLPEPFIVQLIRKLTKIVQEYAIHANNSCPLFFDPNNVFIDGALDAEDFDVYIIMDYLELLVRPFGLDSLSYSQLCYMPLDYLTRVENSTAEFHRLPFTHAMIAWNIGAVMHYSIYHYNLINLPFATVRNDETEKELLTFPLYYSDGLYKALISLLNGDLGAAKPLTYNTQQEKQYLAAIRAGDVFYVRQHKQEMRGIRGKNGYTGLMLAVTYNWLDLVKELVSTEAKMVTPTGFTALMLACIYNKPDLVLLLRAEERGLKLPNGKTAMMIAAAQNHLDCVKALAVKEYELGIQDSLGKTALMHAIFMHNKETCLYLAGLEYGYQDCTGATALSYLVGYHNFPDFDSIAAKLVEHPEELVANHDGETPYLYAVSNGNLCAVQLLKNLGVIDKPDTGLQHAYRCGQIDVAKILSPDEEENDDLLDSFTNVSLDSYLPLIYGLKGSQLDP